MSFRPWSRWRSERAPSSTLAEEVNRLAADPRVHRLFDWFSRHERDIADFQLAITGIPAPPFGEQARAVWLAERFRPLGLNLTIDAVGNVLALRPAQTPQPEGHDRSASGGSGNNLCAPAIALSAHLDTVFPASTPINPRREQAQLIAPGISDNGSGLAALWALAAALHEVGITTALPLLFIANVGEEGEGNLRGMRHLYREHLGSASANGGSRSPDHKPAPTDTVSDASPAPAIAMLIALDGAGTDNIISQALGSRRFEVVITGPGGHSWSDYGTPNPIVAASLAIAALSRIALPANPRTTLNVGSIQGGTSINTIPEHAIFKVDFRSSDPRRLDELEEHLRRALADGCAQAEARAPSSYPRLNHSIAIIGERPAGELPDSSPLLAAIRAVDAQLKIRSSLLRASTDANIPLSLGLEAVSLGAGGSGGGAHTVNEWFDPAGREQGLKRLVLLVLLLAGFPASATGGISTGQYSSVSSSCVPGCGTPSAEAESNPDFADSGSVPRESA